MDVAAAVVVDCLDEIAVGAKPLVVDEESGILTTALLGRDIHAREWLRRAVRPGGGEPWPSGGPYSSALLRMQKSKEALDFALHAAASVVAPGAPVIVFGANDEGIRSAARHLSIMAEDASTLATRRHCRVLSGQRRREISGLKGTLAAWRIESEIAVGDGTSRWVSYPGVFAKGGPDAGTALLIRSIDPMPGAARVLDFATGTGVVAASILARSPMARLDMIEIDSVALAAARENVPGARGYAGASLSAAPQRHYDLIVSNPPIHEGVRESYRVLEALIADSVGRLAPGGELRIVVQKRVPASELISNAFGGVALIAEDTRFRVLSGRKAVGR